jgi:toxin ParE1/3/4
MSLHVRYSPRALRDLNEIWTYSFDHWGEERTDAYVIAIRDTMALLSSNPGLSRDAEEIRPGLRKYSVGSHILFFRIDNKEIAVTRILHSRMDVDRHI